MEGGPTSRKFVLCVSQQISCHAVPDIPLLDFFLDFLQQLGQPRIAAASHFLRNSHPLLILEQAKVRDVILQIRIR